VSAPMLADLHELVCRGMPHGNRRAALLDLLAVVEAARLGWISLSYLLDRPEWDAIDPVLALPPDGPDGSIAIIACVAGAITAWANGVEGRAENSRRREESDRGLAADNPIRLEIEANARYQGQGRRAARHMVTDDEAKRIAGLAVMPDAEHLQLLAWAKGRAPEDVARWLGTPDSGAAIRLCAMADGYAGFGVALWPGHPDYDPEYSVELTLYTCGVCPSTFADEQGIREHQDHYQRLHASDPEVDEHDGEPWRMLCISSNQLPVVLARAAALRERVTISAAKQAARFAAAVGGGL